MVDVLDEGSGVYPVEADVRVLSIHALESPDHPPVSHTVSRFGDFIDESRLAGTTVPDPLKLRGVGNTTLSRLAVARGLASIPCILELEVRGRFGLNSRFDNDFPSSLRGKVASEEFHSTLSRINSILQKSFPLNLKCLLCGCLCCCCTLGLSLGPVLYLSKRTRSRIEKLLDGENWRLYNKLGLNLRLHREQCEHTNLREYVLLVEFLPKNHMYQPE